MDVTPSGKPRIGYSVASRQRRLGPAPLASFEDLPSDEQVSPDSERFLSPNSEGDHDYDKILSQNYRAVLEKPSEEALSGDLTPTNETDGQSLKQEVVSKNGQFRDSAFERNLSPASSGEVTPRVITTPTEFDKDPNKASWSYLLTPGPSDGEKTPSPDPGSRKNSWTDLLFFRTRNRSRSKSPINSETGSAPKTPPSVPNCDEGMSKNKKGFFSFLKFPRKLSSAHEENSAIPSQENAIIRNEYANISTPRVSVTDTSENEVHELFIAPEDLNEPQESKQDVLELSSSFSEDEEKDGPIFEKNKPGTASKKEPLRNTVSIKVFRKLKSRTETIDEDCQSLPEKLPSSCKKKYSVGDADTVKLETGLPEEKSYSSDSDIDSNTTLYAETKKKDSETKESEDEIEVIKLLTQDSVDTEDLSLSEHANKFQLHANRNDLLKIRSRKDRLEVSTVPVERPRSTTPINIASLEDYIKSVAPTGDQNVEKIKLSLPGDQFSGSSRSKSPRRGNPQIWLDFCEKGLQSPKNRHRKNSKSKENQFLTNLAICDAFIPLNDPTSQAVTPLTPITPLDFDDPWTPFDDNFNPFKFSTKLEDSNCRSSDGICVKCKCMPNDDNPNANYRETIESSAAETEEIKASSNNSTESDESCGCECHANKAKGGFSEFKQDCVFSISSDISSASSRLIQASSPSSSKCTSEEDENEDKPRNLVRN